MSKKPVWVHGDFSSGNILVKSGRLAGIIDFGGMAIGDPSCDLVVAWTLFKAKSRKIFKSALELDEDILIQARGWALWKALITLESLDNKAGKPAHNQLFIINEILSE